MTKKVLKQVNLTNAIKKKLSDFALLPFTFELVHPEGGNTGATVTIVSTNCNAFISKSMELNNKFTNVDPNSVPYDQQMLNTAELYASVVIGWDEEFFEKEFTTDNVIEVLKDPQNIWILSQITNELQKHENFFPKI